MKIIARVAVISCVALGLAGGRASAALNLIDVAYGVGAGSFELGTYIDTVPGAGYMRLAPGSTTITGWTVGVDLVGGVDWLRYPIHSTANGNYAIDVCGDFGDGSLSTSISTIVGDSYTISFAAYGGNYPMTGILTAGTLTQSFSPPAQSDAGHATYYNYQYDFTANATTTVIKFKSTGSVGFGPVIDSVVVIPEPSGILVLAGGLVFCRRRR